MKMRKMIACISTAAIILVQCPITASASSLSREELLAKYAYLLQTEPSFEYISGQYVEEEYPYRFEAHGDAAYMPKTGEVVRSGKTDGFRFEILDTGQARINGLDDAEIDAKAETLIIPEMIDGCPVAEIGYRAFENCYKKMPALKEIRIPDSVEIIAEGAFCDAFNYDSCRSGSGENQKVPKFPEDIKINIPENVVFIGYEAYKYDISAISNAQNKDRIIHLPETLEYISCSALGCVYRRFQGGFEIDMPESLVCMSDYCFDQYYPHNGLTKRRYIKPTIGDVSEFREEDLPLIMNYINAGFYQGEQNIVTFGELYGATVVAQEQTANYWYGNPSSLVPDDKLEYHNITSLFAGACADAAKYAPEYLPENVRTAAKAKVYSDMKVNQTPGIAATGDIDQNGEINIADAILLARYIAEDNDISITEDGITAADLDADGYVTAMDQNKLLELIAHADL